jgi:hypothetical protein
MRQYHQVMRPPTGISLPIKIVLGVAVAAQVDAGLLARRAVCKRDVVVGNVVEKVQFVLAEHQRGGDRVYRRVAPALVKEAAVPVEQVEEIGIGVAAQPREAANLKVGPL